MKVKVAEPPTAVSLVPQWHSVDSSWGNHRGRTAPEAGADSLPEHHADFTF